MTVTIDKIASALATNSDRLVMDKASIASQTANSYCSLWRSTGQPGQGSIPSTAANCNNTTTGCFGVTNQTAPLTGYIGYFEFASSNAAMTLELHDRLIHMGGLSGTATTAQTVGIDFNGVTADNMANRIGDANYSDIQWWLEWYTATGSSAVTITCAVTYSDGSTGNLTAISLAATRPASHMIAINGYIPAAKSGLAIRGISTVTLSATTGTVGSFGVTATRKRCSVFAPIANANFSANWADLPISKIPSSSCVFPIVLTSTTSTGTARGGGKVMHIDPS